jgi:hypothetical protein
MTSFAKTSRRREAQTIAIRTGDAGLAVLSLGKTRCVSETTERARLRDI